MKALKDIDPHNSLTDEIEEGRKAFAEVAIHYAAECKNNDELIKELQSILPKDFLVLIGEGSTRRCFATPIGVVLKVQREDPYFIDPLKDDELEERGGYKGLPYLVQRRRFSNLSEMGFAARFPRLAPKQYGFLASFGTIPSHPSVLISETVKTLDRFFPGDKRGIDIADMRIDADGFLQIFDSRITSMKPPSDLITYEALFGAVEPRQWLGNIGVSPAGRFVLADRSNHLNLTKFLNPLTMSPFAFGWKFDEDIDKTRKFSVCVFETYLEVCKQQQPMKGGKHDKKSQRGQ